MNKWDQKAKSYNRYNENKDNFEQRIFSVLNDSKIDFKDKTLLDVGAGTGVYTLHIAKLALQIDAIDSSKEMLKILEEDAKKLGLNNIKTFVTTWEEFKLNKVYDFSLCTMSPAINSQRDIDKFDKSATCKIYLGWAGKRDTIIIEELFKAHGSIYQAPNGALKVKNWLTKEKKSFKIFPFEEEKIRVRNFDDAVENFTWHLDVRGITPNKEKIKKVLDRFKDEDENVKEVTINHMNLIIWE